MRFVVTAGPTREFLDPVRFLSNPSTGTMGFAVARAAKAAGHAVTLIAGPVVLTTPRGVERIDVVSARDMLAAVQKATVDAEVLVMTAAVADWRPAHCAAAKLKKREMGATLRLVRNPDILKTLKKDAVNGDLLKIGFAAETGEPSAEAVRKCREKGLALVVGNDVTSPGCGFGTRTNRVTLVTPEGKIETLPLMSKLAVAKRIVRFAENAVRKKQGKSK